MSAIDVFIPCYRYGHFLKECVESVLSQSGVDVRVLIIDDASPDNTAEVGAQLARGDPRVTLSKHSVNKGHIATYNEGIEWASADYVLLLSADDYLLPGSLKRATMVMDVHPEVGFVFGRAVEFVDKAEIYRRDTPANAIINGLVGCESYRVLRGVELIGAFADRGATNFISTPTAVVRTSLQKKVGGYRVELPHSGDWEMWLRLSANGHVGIVSEYQAVYRLHNASMSGGYSTRKGLADIEQRRAALGVFFSSHGRALPNSTELLRSLMASLALSAVQGASWAFNDGERELSGRFSQLALDIFPEIKNSRAWKVVTLKRRIGVTMSRALVAAVKPVRRRFEAG
jgi:glycosyltransferase involved in cell wall biosynthesis